MKQHYLKTFFCILIGLSLLKPIKSNAQSVSNTEFDKTTPKRDLRGVFLPSIYNLTWPTNRNASPAAQQAELIAILDNIEANGYNSLFFQIRPESDALYNSTIEPWSYWLSGTQGTAPSPLWDPLEFAITEAHARGLDLHAWLNPYRAQNGSYTTAANHVTNTHPEWIFTASNNANLKLLDPGLPEVRDHIVAIIEDIASRYDVDGIHFDDYFYPSGGMAAAPNNQDSQTYTNHNPTNISNIDNWRRNNVNLMIGMVYDAIQTANTTYNKNIVFGVSPFGIWKSGTPSGIVGTSSYSALYCDPIAWLEDGKVDYLAPQLYWEITGPQDYTTLSKWWNDQSKLYNKQLYVSLAYYKMDNWLDWDSAEFLDQISQNRSSNMDATFGQIGYSYSSIKNNSKNLNGSLKNAPFKYKSFAPPILGTGKDNIYPNPPENIRFESLKIVWDTPAAATDGDLPSKYVIYAFENAAEAITNMNDGSKILDIVSGNELAITQTQKDTKFLVVTSLDKNNNESGDFTQDITLGITKETNFSSVIFPVPFDNNLNIKLPNSYFDNKIKLQLFDIMGRKVYDKTHSVYNNTVRVNDLSTLSTGSYFIYLLDTNQKVLSKKHIIKRN